MEKDIAVLALLVVTVLLSTLRIGDKTRMDRVERKLDLIIKHLGIEELGPAQQDSVDELLRQGKKIEAIKRYREITGAGLKDAKEAVERRAV